MYTITERKDRLEPQDSDPPAQAMKRHSGMFDLRLPDGGILVSSGNLKWLRNIQARWNTNFVLDRIL